MMLPETEKLILHYDLLVEENNDPVHDPEALKAYMNKWDGQVFLDELQLSKNKSVLEIGVGTGRLAVRTAPLCRDLVGVDISPKTIGRAKENCSAFQNIVLICDDFMSHRFERKFDVIYSSLTFLHIEKKAAAIDKIAGLLSPGGRAVLSLNKKQDEFLEMNGRKVRLYPDNPEEISEYLSASGLTLENRQETEFAFILSAKKKA